MTQTIETLLADYAASQGQLSQVNRDLAEALEKLPVSSYGHFEGPAQDEDGAWWSVQISWHTIDPAVSSFSVEPMCSHDGGDNWQESRSCQFCGEDGPRFEGDRAEIAISAIVRSLSEALESSRAQVTQRNKLARALRSALGNK